MLEKEISARSLQLEGHVGFDSLPDQQVSKAVQKGFVFNILCIGETGVGKSTLIDSLFNVTFDCQPTPHEVPTVSLKSQSYELWEKNVQMKLTIIDTVGYGDQVNKENSFKSIVDFVDQQYEAYLQEELKVERCMTLYHDSRVHVCLYFISPTGHGLKSIDLECMKQLDSKVNIIPLIAKADAISKCELQQFKERIMQELTSNGIRIYQFPTDDETISETNAAMNAYLPFAVVGSREFSRVGNKMTRGRQYPWGIVQVENDAHCDTARLREMLIRTNMEDLREQTHVLHYELYRTRRLKQMGFTDDTFNSNSEPISFTEACKTKMLLHHQDLAQKEEALKQKFILRVQEKEAEIKEEERKLHERMDELKEEHAKEKTLLEDYHKQLDDEIAEFQKLTMEYESELSPKKQQSSGFHHTFSLGSLKGKKK